MWSSSSSSFFFWKLIYLVNYEEKIYTKIKECKYWEAWNSSSSFLLFSCYRKHVFIHYQRNNTKVHIIKCIKNLGSVLMHVPCIHVERNWLVIRVIRLVKWFVNVGNSIEVNVRGVVWNNIRKSKKQLHISIQYIKKIIITIAGKKYR